MAEKDVQPKEEIASQPKPVQEPDFVVVSDSVTGEPMELPTNAEDSSLLLATLTHAFPGAHGLKYKNPATGALRALLTDTNGNKFFPPAGGWTDKVFYVIFQNDYLKRSGDLNPKRKKMMDESVTSDSDGESGLHHGSQVTAKLQRLNEEDEDRLARKNPIKNDSTGSSASLETEKEKEKESLKEKKGDQKLPCSDLIVLGLPYKLTDKELRDYFEQYGKVVLCEVRLKAKNGEGKGGKTKILWNQTMIIKHSATGESKGFGFIQMDTIEQQCAVLKEQHTIGSRKCQVKLPASKGADGSETVKLFVGRITNKITYNRLKEFFMGEVKKIDPNSTLTDVFVPSPSRGFGFITVSSPYVAKVLLKKEDFLIDDVSVILCLAAPKVPPPAALPLNLYTQPVYRARRPVWEHQERYGREYEATGSPLPSGSNSIATGLETLNLNNMQPGIANEAWKDYWTAAPSYAHPNQLMRPGAYPPGTRGSPRERHNPRHRPFEQNRHPWR